MSAGRKKLGDMTDGGLNKTVIAAAGGCKSETGRIQFRGVRFQTPNSVSLLGLTEFRGANSVSSSQPIICV